MSIFIIKIIACITMLLDHVKYAIPTTNGFVTKYLGRIAFPLFAFVAVEGYIHTSNLKKYIKRLIIFGLISEIPYILFKSIISGKIILELNVIFTILLGIISIYIYDKIKNKYLGFLLALIPLIIGQGLRVDYGWYGVGLILLIYLIKNSKIKFISFYILYTILYYFISFIEFNFGKILFYMPYIVFSCFPIIFMILYNNKLGRKIKYFYYWFYPVHLILLFIISKFI